MQIGIGLPNTLDIPGPQLLDWARRAEERGFSTLATIDRIVYPNYDSLSALAAAGAVTTEHVVDGGPGVRLQGLHSVVPGVEPRGLALLLHGWEGSAESSYMRQTAARLLERGFATFRLNFRDHGDSHHLNEAIFHSNRIEEVVFAARDVARRFWPEASASRPLVAAGN
jgi:predicted alpha/beta-fold hydrolase